MVGVTPSKYLSLILKTPEGAGVNDAVAVSLVIVAEGMRRLGIAAALRLLDAHGVTGQVVVPGATHQFLDG
jgi:hypothetical protein